jgi:hypothetical protein
MGAEELLEYVVDQKSFIAFVEALATERRQAARLEAEQPVCYQLGGALGWYNGDIASFLEAALTYFQEGPLKACPEPKPNWRMLAEFLYCGKIIE